MSLPLLTAHSSLTTLALPSLLAQTYRLPLYGPLLLRDSSKLDCEFEDRHPSLRALELGDLGVSGSLSVNLYWNRESYL